MTASIVVESIFLAEAYQAGGERRLSARNYEHQMNINSIDKKEGDEQRK